MTQPYADWRLVTPERGIRYKILGMTGEITSNVASATLQAIIRATDLQDFMLELMPDPVRVGNIQVWRAETLPGFPSMAIDRVRFKPKDEDLPIDPFGHDSTAPAGTYGDLLELLVDYSSNKNPKKRTPDANDPKTFLEISSTTTYEVINTYAGASTWEIKNNPNVEEGGGAANAEDGGDETWINPSTGQLMGVHTDPDTGQQVRGPIESPDDPSEASKPNKQAGSTPISIIVPITNWQIRWPEVEHKFFEEVLIGRFRSAGGKVNRLIIPFLYDLPPGTLLFTGWSYVEKNSWRELSGNSDNPTLEITMNFSEKFILWDGVVRGWNDYWSNEEGGWREMKFDGVNHPYKKWDHNLLFTTS